MSIDPLSGLRAPGANATTRRGKGTANDAFAKQLERATAAQQATAAAARAQQLIGLVRLQLLHGLFDDENDTSASDRQLTSLLPAPVASRPEAVPRRVEQLYRQLQPSLRPAGPPERAEIDRLIERVAKQVSLAPELIRSVVATESDFQPQAVSSAGAQGLMQLMPATARELGVSDSFDPQQNLLGGSRYLKQLLDKYHGDLDKALAAYNWGPGNVDRLGLEQMPQETRDYLAKVKGRLVAT